MIARMFYSQLPLWARPTHPMMRYILGYRDGTQRRVLLRIALVILLAGLVVGLSYVAVRTSNPDESPSYREFMYYPLVGATLLMQILAIAITTNSIALERQKGTWETLQISLVGAQTSIRSRWASVFYRLRWVLAFVMIGRLGYLLFLMNDLTDFEGRAIDVRIIGISPEISLEVAVFLIAALMTAAILQPLIALGFDAAVGMLIATITQKRNVGILTTVMLIGVRVCATVGALILGNQIIDQNGTTAEILNLSTNQAWLRVLALVSQGDLSLRILNLEALGNLWADLKNGVYLGGIVLVVVVVQAVLANLMVLFAAWRASKPARS